MAACHPISIRPSQQTTSPSPIQSPVDVLTQKIIAYFEGHPITERCRPQPPQITLSAEDRSLLRHEWNVMDPCFSETSFIFIGNGMTRMVYTHFRFPHLVFKPMTLCDATHQAFISAKAIELVQTKNLFFIHIPPAEVIELSDIEGDTRALYVEERLPIELSCREYHFIYQHLTSHLDNEPSNTFENNFKLLISQVAEFIWELGYDDVTTENGPLFNTIDGKEVCFTDFDEIPKDPRSRIPKAQIGINFLFEMFPHDKTIEALTSIVSRFPEKERSDLFDSLSAFSKDSNWDLLDRSNYMLGAFPF